MTYGRTSTKTLTDYNDPSTSSVVTLPDGFTGSDLRFHGIVVPAGRLTLDQCVFKGPKVIPTSGDHALLRCFNKRAGQAVVSHSTFVPQTKGNSLNDLLGWQYELYSCDLSGGIDGAGAYASSNTGSNSAKVVIEDTWIHALSYFYPDKITTSHTDGTHSDCVQIQGGTDIRLTRVKLDGYAAAAPGSGVNPSKPWLLQDPNHWNNGADLIVQNNTGINPNVVVEDCEFSGSLAQMNIKPGVVMAIKGSRHHYDVANTTGYSRYYIRFDQKSATPGVTGLETAVFVDGPNQGKRLVDAGGVKSDR